MYPILYDGPYLFITSWHFCFLLGALIAYTMICQNNEQYHRLFMILYLASYFGARLYSIVFEQNLRTFSEIISELTILGPMTFYGGFILALISAGIYLYFTKLNPKKIADDFLLPAFIAAGVGRIGCFLNGDDYGIILPSDSLWAVRFPNHMPQDPRLPIQLIEAFALFFAMALLLKLKKPILARYGEGFLGIGSLLVYSLLRFSLEFFRADPREFWVPGYLSAAQGMSLVLFGVSVVITLRYRRKNSTFSHLNQSHSPMHSPDVAKGNFSRHL